MIQHLLLRTEQEIFLKCGSKYKIHQLKPIFKTLQ